jgi:adenosyl cobinamide kinase/adenosyl cobinamide phosphate guanylyltransferase
MPMVLLLGGARSGKSRLAARLAAASGRRVVVVATGEARDEEMAERIRRHREERPPGWETIEEAVDLEGALTRAQEDAYVLVDCLTLWVSNLMEHSLTATEIEERARKAATIAAARAGGGVVVSNEVGSGIVPIEASARTYRDSLGAVNAAWSEAADRSLLVVAGRVLALSDPDDVPPEARGG